MARLLLIFTICLSLSSFSQSILPVPDHIVIVVMENHSYSQIIGSKEAPNINTLAKSSNVALFTQSYGATYPSQPNYISLFSGCSQGIIDDTPPKNIPFTTANLGRQLIDAGRTFISFAEDLPHTGFGGETSGNYVRRHNPAVYWMGDGTNQLPSTSIQPFTAFPRDFNLLPTVCFVIPNNVNNMHDGTVAQGDKWIYTHLFNYIQWAKTHNSLFILTFDEDDKSQDNQITTIFAGNMVKAGRYSKKINHYSILRTIEDMYHLPFACNAATVETISSCWEVTDSTPSIHQNNQIAVVSNSTLRYITVMILKDSLLKNLKLSILNIQGAKLKEIPVLASVSNVSLNDLSAGVYVYLIADNNKIIQKGKIVLR